MKEMHQYLYTMRKHPEQRFVLATVIRVDGSAYRHVGAKMLFSETGEEYGMVSGGCVEEDLSFRVKEVLNSNVPQTISYDLRSEDDLGWGQGAGCNGKVYVYLERMQWTEETKKAGWERVFKELEEGHSVVTIKAVDGIEKGSVYFFQENGKALLEPPFLFGGEEASGEMFKHFQKTGEAFTSFEWGPENSTYIAEVFDPVDTLYLFGAGRDVEPLVKKLAEYHFSTIVIDPRQSRCTKENFPSASEWICEHPEKFLQEKALKNNSYVLIMTHSFERDRFIMRNLLPKKEELAYLGVLGPKRRTVKLLDGAAVPKWVSSPIGLDIHAEGAEEISISILAELIATRNKRKFVKGDQLAVI
ncbi:hypothetical protein CR194_04220 [Salipaludibacillus keqinensis]|uniref:Xanthine dehydrogenase n=1 Tax=Salipaludibacillus keqinensis TaxID=2045207 RepID=A0A323TKV3_9BACI|nr:XdhC family protein [Salipaludibacillus keqinensis]PYZ94746.1 hypothetical protein CR194_04220 [Salipaludibacillus keqinensis]